MFPFRGNYIMETVSDLQRNSVFVFVYLKKIGLAATRGLRTEMKL